MTDTASRDLLRDSSPLNDPDYVPLHPPIGGRVPAVVERFGPRTQIRWFQRFRDQLQRPVDGSRYHTESLLHRDWCCWQCEGDEWTEPWDGPGCCCRGLPD